MSPSGTTLRAIDQTVSPGCTTTTRAPAPGKGPSGAEAGTPPRVAVTVRTARTRPTANDGQHEQREHRGAGDRRPPGSAGWAPHRAGRQGSRTCVRQFSTNVCSLSRHRIERMFDLPPRTSVRCRHDRDRSHRPPARGPAGDRAAHARAGLPAVGARDRRGGGADVAVHGPLPPQHARATRLPPSRSHQAACDRGPVGLVVRRRDGAPADAARAARRRRRGGHRRAGPRERRGAVAVAGRLHRRGRPLHAAGARRLDDRRRNS